MLKVTLLPGSEKIIKGVGIHVTRFSPPRFLSFVDATPTKK